MGLNYQEDSALSNLKLVVGFAGVGCEEDLEGVTTCERNCSWPHGSCYNSRCACQPKYAGHDCSIELRHGRLAHALDSAAAKLGAVVAVGAVSTCIALALVRFINVGPKVFDNRRGLVQMNSDAASKTLSA